MWQTLRILLLCTLPAASYATIPLQPLLDRIAPGGVVRLPPGDYRGPALIDKPLSLDGQNQARLVGDGRGTVLIVATNGARVRNLAIVRSGDSHDRVDAGLLVIGDNNVIEGNTFDDVLFGIHVKGGSRNRITGNRVRGKDLPQGLRGDALRVWNGRDNLITGNTFWRARDITFANAPDNRIANNVFRDGRYGMHLVFSPRIVIENNRLEQMATGIVAMYSPQLVIRGNTVREVHDGGGAALVFKDSGGAQVSGNAIVHCTTGLLADAPLNTELTLLIENNRFAHNLTGLAFYGELGGHVIRGNRFENNLTQVFISAPKVGEANRWQNNYWSDYQGFDRNGDGLGDTPHEAWLFADRIWQEFPPAKFFAHSPLFELIDFLERLAPFSAPHRILRDERPRMR